MWIEIISTGDEQELWYSQDLGWSAWLAIPLAIPIAWGLAQILQELLG